MKVNIVKPVEINIKYLAVHCGDYIYPEDIGIGNDEYEDFDELFKKYPSLKGNQDCLYLLINVDNGKVENWPDNIAGYFDIVKVVDTGTYILMDEYLNQVIKVEGYVPCCLSINREGYGDYFEFNINKDGYVNNWKFSQKDVDEFVEQEKY